jgi:hypothetical protein
MGAGFDRLYLHRGTGVYSLFFTTYDTITAKRALGGRSAIAAKHRHFFENICQKYLDKPFF